MEITEVRIKLMEDAGDRLQAFCSITFDDAFVIRDLKIIDGTHGPFVAMPSRKLTSRCAQCGAKNHLRAAYCNQCGMKLKEERAIKDDMGRAKLYADIAHPINSACREMIQERIIAEFFVEIERSKQPGYVSRYEDFDAGEDYSHHDEGPNRPAARREPDAPHELPAPPHHANAGSVAKAPARESANPHPSQPTDPARRAKSSRVNPPESRLSEERSAEGKGNGAERETTRSATPPPPMARSRTHRHAPTPPASVNPANFGAGIF